MGIWKGLTGAGREERTLELLLRIGVAGCFIGHGAFGIIGKAAWLPYFAVAGIGEELAWTLMPVVGTLDILVGISVLLAPRRAALLYAAVWALWTALLRPLAGESAFETLERAGNYGVPLAFLILVGVRTGSWRAWLAPASVPRMSAAVRRRVVLTLRATTALLLVGHGGLALAGKPLLVEHLAALGLPAGALTAVGWLEIGLAGAVLLGSIDHVLIFVLLWKLGTEALYPLTGAPIWELVERAGSYIAPLALWTLTRQPAAVPAGRRSRAPYVAGALALLFGAGVMTVGAAQVERARQATRPGAADSALLERLRAGGFVFACRHAITDRSRGDRRPVRLSDRSTQRVLSAEGERQARRLGEAIRRLDIPVGGVFASPYFRTKDSAELAFGRVETTRGLMYGRSREQLRERRRLFRRPPADRTNRVLMTHQGILYSILDGVERGSVAEGDCVIVRPDGAGDLDIVRRLAPEDWGALQAQQRGVGRAIEAVRAGGTVIVCRHAATGSFRETEPVDYDDPSTQRRLDAGGERQARTMGRALRALGVEITELVASPMQRARRTAALMLDRPVTIDSIWHTNGSGYEGPARDRRAAVLATPVPRGNRLIVSHIGTMRSVLPIRRRRVREGDCVVVRPDPSAVGFELLGIVPWRAWADAAGTDG